MRTARRVRRTSEEQVRVELENALRRFLDDREAEQPTPPEGGVVVKTGRRTAPAPSS
jgi:hypothetical protein